MNAEFASHYNCRVRDDIIAAAVDDVTRVVIEALARDEAPTADALRLLLRAHAATGREDVRDALEPALALALEIAGDSPSADVPRWLLLFAEAIDASEDERLREAASNLATKLRMNWAGLSDIAAKAASLDAFFYALPVLGKDAVDTGALQAALDELERTVSATYEPGQGVEGTLDNQIHVASALLSAFSLTDRLPYSMLAEELVQHGRAALLSGKLAFAVGCEAADVLSRLSELHQREEYRAAAVIAPDANYAEDAALILERLAPEASSHGLAGAAYGLAAGELQSAFPCQ